MQAYLMFLIESIQMKTEYIQIDLSEKVKSCIKHTLDIYILYVQNL